MWPDPQETVNLVTFTEEILNGNFIFWAVFYAVFSLKILDCVPSMRFLKHVWLTTSEIII